MRIYIRYQGQPVSTRILEAGGIYRVGRGTDCEICYPNPRVSRLQGTIDDRGGQWKFVDSGTDKNSPVTYLLTQDQKAVLPNGLEILSEHFIEGEMTMVGQAVPVAAPAKQRRSSRAVFAAAFVIVAIIGAAALAYFYQSKQNAPMNAYSILEYAKPRTVIFEAKRDEKQVEEIIQASGLAKTDFRESYSYCTGFVVAPGIVMTANHCIFDELGRELEKRAVIRDEGHKEHPIASVLGFDPLLDFALLSVPTLEQSAAFKFADSWRMGDAVFTVGNVHGEGLAIRDGIVASETEDPSNPEIKYLRFSAGASPGNSGGPLLNARGEVVGLISKKTFAENYNVAIRVGDLKTAIAEYASGTEPKKITLNAKSLTVLKQPQMIYALSESMRIPFPGLNSPLVATETENDASSLSVSVQVPAPAQEIGKAMSAGLAEWLRAVQSQKVQKAIANGKPGIDWREQVTKDVPLVVPMLEDDKSQISLENGRIGFSNDAPVHSPGARGYESLAQQYKDQSGNGIRTYAGGRNYTSPATGPQWDAHQAKLGYKLRISNSYERAEARMLEREMLADTQLAIDFKAKSDESQRAKQVAEILENWVVGGEGAVVSLATFEFLRPDSRNQFKISKLPAPFKIENRVTDKLGREWKLYSTDVYSLVRMDFACLDSDMRTYCQLIPAGSLDQRLSEPAIRGIADYELSDLREFMNFVPTEELKGEGNVGASRKHAELEDFDWKEANGQLSVTLKSLGKTIEVGPSKSVHQVRFIPGLFYNEVTKLGEWKALGVETLAHDGSKFKNCTAGVDFADYHYLGFTVDAPDLRLPASVQSFIKKARGSKPEFFRAPTSTTFLGHKAEIFGVCNQLNYSKETKTFENTMVVEPWHPKGL